MLNSENVLNSTQLEETIKNLYTISVLKSMIFILRKSPGIRKKDKQTKSSRLEFQKRDVP